MTHADRSRLARAGCALLAVLASAPAAADRATPDHQVHGFAAQGFALSDGNNVIGDSTNGNIQYFEIGVNATVQTDYGVLLSAQELVRKSGALDDGDLRLDYGFVDYQALTGPGLDAGLRAGRVKNPFGLFNETRDVVFTRPGILLPLSVYFDTSGVRSLLFSADGGQAYGGWSHGGQHSTLIVTKALDFSASEDEKRTFGAGGTLNGDLRFSDFVVARVMNDWSAGIFRLAVSYASANLSYAPSPSDPFPIVGNIDFDLYVLSARYNAERYSLTGEYQLTQSEGTFGAPIEGKSDGFYLQGDYRFRPNWSAMARFDASFSDRNDRAGDTCTSNGAPADRHACYTLGTGVGLQWQPAASWGLWGEFHVFDGNSAVPTIENMGRAVEPHWNLLLLMAAYRF